MSFGTSIRSVGFCGGEICGFDECAPGDICCELCFGDAICVPAGESCPDIDCGGCFFNEDCPPTDFCLFEAGLCEPFDIPGICAPRPAACPPECPGACGCDGSFFCSECEAHSLGVNVNFDIMCDSGVPCDGFFCAPGEYCDLGPLCGGAGGPSCIPRPTGCDDIFAPVCGCDRMTYSNACEAAAVGMTVEHIGECEGPPTAARSCREIQLALPGAASGVYAISPEPGILPAVDVFCDMATDGGGWTLVASTRRTTLDDAAGPYHGDLQTRSPSAPHPFVWDGMRSVMGTRSDVRFTCRDGSAPGDDELVDLSFYDVIWYEEWTRGTDEDSCFSEGNGRGFDRPEPARRDNVSGVALRVSSPWTAGFLEGEDSCGDTRDFTVDFRDRGMDSDQGDGTDWGEDDGSPKCGRGPIMDGIWQIWAREP